jgi:hypothetical protein
MKLLTTFTALACLAVAAPALALQQPVIAKAEDPLPATTLSRKGQASKLDPAVPLYLVAESSPKTQVFLRNALSGRGFTLANEPGPGVKTLTIGFYMQASVIKMKPILFNIEDFIASPDTNGVAIKSAEMDTASAVSNAMSETVMLATGITNFAAGVTGLASALINLSGIGGAFNEAVVGDPRGACFLGCENWNRYIQIVSLAVIESTPNGDITSLIKIVTKDEKLLYPTQLFQVALGTLSSDLLGDPMPQVFADAKNTPTPEPKNISDSGFSTGW